MTISKTAGTKMYIGPVTNPDTITAMADVDAIAFFAGISGGSWIEIGEIESFGDLGDNSEVATFVSVANRRTRKLKTTRDAGTMAIVCGRDPLDDGQNAAIAAEKTDYNYAFKVVYSDARDTSYTQSVEYFVGAVMSRPTNLADAKAITKRTFNIAVNTAVYAVPSDSLSAPTNTAKPSISGAATTQGTILTALNGLWTGDPVFTYQWQRDSAGNGTFANISGATAKTYTLAAGDANNCVRIQVTGTNGAGNATANSLPTKAVT